MAESFSRERLDTHRRRKKRRWMRNPVRPSSCVTPAGTSNELDVQNKWEENTTLCQEPQAIISQGMFGDISKCVLSRNFTSPRTVLHCTTTWGMLRRSS